MGDKTGIEWTDATWNPIRGCSRVSEGCRHCYAETVAHRFGAAGGPYAGLTNHRGAWNGKIMEVPSMLDQPLRWQQPRRIFVNSMSDLFHENLRDEYIDRIFAVMMLAQRHTFQVLTKRPERAYEYLRQVEAERDMQRWWNAAESLPKDVRARHGVPTDAAIEWPLRNVWLGTSVEDQATADHRIPLLLETPAWIRWISAEPLLGPVNLEHYLGIAMCEHDHAYMEPDTGALVCSECENEVTLDWVVVGGESGPDSRPMHARWAREIRGQCGRAGVPFLFKQWGDWAPAMSGMYFYPLEGCPQFASRAGGRDTHDWGDGIGAVRIGKKNLGRELDGIIHDGYPR